MKLSRLQREVLERMKQGQRIVYFPPTQSAWFYLDPLKDRVRLRVTTFYALSQYGMIRHAETVGADRYYDITVKGRVAVLTI